MRKTIFSIVIVAICLAIQISGYLHNSPYAGWLTWLFVAGSVASSILLASAMGKQRSVLAVPTGALLVFFLLFLDVNILRYVLVMKAEKLTPTEFLSLSAAYHGFLTPIAVVIVAGVLIIRAERIKRQGLSV